MSYVKAKIPDTVYHLTRRENLNKILADKTVRRFGDRECWFCRSIPDLLRYMEYTVLCEGKPYYDVDGSVKHYPKFKSEDYAVLKLTPRYREGNWYQWNQELPRDASPELTQQGKEFSRLKIGFRGDLRFKKAEVFDLPHLMEVKRQETMPSDEEYRQKENETNELLLAEDAVQTTAYLVNAPDCCSGGEQLGNVLGMLGADVMDDTIYHDESQHSGLKME